MSVRVASKKVDVHRRQEIITLVDDFGTRHIVQLNLMADHDHETLLKSEIANMTAREEKFKAKLKERGHDVEALMKQCHCGGKCKDCK